MFSLVSHSCLFASSRLLAPLRLSVAFAPSAGNSSCLLFLIFQHLSLAHQWAKRTSTAKRNFSATEESGRASISRSCTKREISALSVAVVFSQAHRTTNAKLKSTYSC